MGCTLEGRCPHPDCDGITSGINGNVNVINTEEQGFNLLITVKIVV